MPPFSDLEDRRRVARESMRKLRGSKSRAERAAAKAERERLADSRDREINEYADGLLADWIGRREKEGIKIVRLLSDYRGLSESQRPKWCEGQARALARFPQHVQASKQAVEDSECQARMERANAFQEFLRDVEGWEDDKLWGFRGKDGLGTGQVRYRDTRKEQRSAVARILTDEKFPRQIRFEGHGYGQGLKNWQHQIVRFVLLTAEGGGEIADPSQWKRPENPWARHEGEYRVIAPLRNADTDPPNYATRFEYLLKTPLTMRPCNQWNGTDGTFHPDFDADPHGHFSIGYRFRVHHTEPNERPSAVVDGEVETEEEQVADL